jgi:hypothetical protein
MEFLNLNLIIKLGLLQLFLLFQGFILFDSGGVKTPTRSQKDLAGVGL